MAQTTVIGRVTVDLELKESVNKNPYIQFGLAEHVGYGETVRTQYFEVWAYKDLAHQLTKSGVKKGSLIWASGALELVSYTRRDGKTKDKKLKLTLKDWGYASGRSGKVTSRTNGADKAPEDPPSLAEVVNGEREPLPE